MVGFEPTTGRLRSDYSTPELHRLVIVSQRKNVSAFDRDNYSVMCSPCQAIFAEIVQPYEKLGIAARLC